MEVMIDDPDGVEALVLFHGHGTGAEHRSMNG
jgi:hypothetical protein